MKCPNCLHEFSPRFPAPAWRTIRAEGMPEAGQRVEIYSQEARTWGRATWTGFSWKCEGDFPHRISHWYDDAECETSQVNKEKP